MVTTLIIYLNYKKDSVFRRRIKLEKLKLNGITINCYIAKPAKGKGPGILLLHAWWGLNEFIKQYCDELAQEGYFVIAPDLYNEKIANTIAQAEEYVEQVDGKVVNPILKKTVDFLLAQPDCSSSKIAVLGFSLGASWASWLTNNKPAEVNKAVLYYGTGQPDFSNTKAEFLCHFAENDPYEESEWVKTYLGELQKAGVKTTYYTYPDTYHWFVESDKEEHYNKEASKLAWERTLEFLRKA